MINIALSLVLTSLQSPDPTVVKRFFEAVTAKNYALARSMVKNDGTPFKRTTLLPIMEGFLANKKLNGEIKITSVRISSTDGKKAFLCQTVRKGKKSEESIAFEMIGSKTVLVASTSEERAPGTIGIFVMLMDNDRLGILERAAPAVQSAADDVQAFSILKELGVGVMLYLADSDDVLPSTNWKKELYAYSKNGSLYSVKKDAATYPISYNLKLSKLNAQKIKNPDKLIMLYIGTDNTPWTGFRGKAYIFVASGRTVPVTPAELKNYRWNP
jgi:hypothetical protein